VEGQVLSANLAREVQWPVRMNLLSHIGFTLWKIGEYSAWIPRTARIPEQLNNLQRLFLDRVRSIWYDVLHLNDADTIYYFRLALCELISETTGTKDP
jgi:hypothetical protein